MGKFIVIEGLDGSGKSTQLELLQQHLNQREVPYHYVHFPRLEEGIYGDLVARFLRGEFGGLKDVNSYLVALIYAGDRKDAAGQITEWMQTGHLVIADRYVLSNIAYQCAKLDHTQDILELDGWIRNLEFSYNNIPEPDLSIFLHVPFAFVSNKLSAGRDGSDRQYLKGSTDIHESDLHFQQRVEEEYIRLFSDHNKACIIDCSRADGTMLPADDIHHQIMDLLKQKNVF